MRSHGTDHNSCLSCRGSALNRCFSWLANRNTKSPAIVTIVAATVASVAYMIYAFLELGYWDKFAVIAFAVSWGYAFVVSFAFIGLGRMLKHAFFVARK